MGQFDHPDLDPDSLVGMAAAEAKALGIQHGVQSVRLVEVDGDRLLWVIGDNGERSALDLVLARDGLTLFVTDGIVISAGF